MTIKNKIQKLISELRDDQYRQAYVEAHAKDTIAFQLRRMRLARGWEQRDVATKLGNPKLQPMISRYENPDYGRYSVTTLLELAKVFDVAVVVRFANFSELLRWDLHKTSATLQPATFVEDVGLDQMGNETWMWRREIRPDYGTIMPLVAASTSSNVYQVADGSPALGAQYAVRGDTRALAHAA